VLHATVGRHESTTAAVREVEAATMLVVVYGE
jgi:hypothetical protein